MATNGNLTPYDNYSPPWWWNVIQAAKFYGCHPEEIMSRSSVWVSLAARVQEIEHHAQEVRQ